MFTDQNYLLTSQYQNAANLDARIQLHLRFSTNSYGWQRWVFDQLDFQENARVLELGCGSAKLWTENLERIPPAWEITLSDFSPGMLEQVRQNLSGAGRPFRFEQVDAQFIPFDNLSFAAVIANHMLSHVPDLPKALGEMRRVLEPGGHLFAATNGANHLRGLDELVKAFDARLEFVEQSALKFTLENGKAQLAPWFSQVTQKRYDDALVVTEAAPLVAYVLSMIRASQLDEDLVVKFSQYVEAKLQQNNGQIRIQKDAGLFIAQG